MTLSELNPIIQSWTDSNEFIDSLVFITQEFSLINADPLIKTVFGLMLKTIKPEEFKTSLLASLPPDKQNEAIVSKLVHASLLPIKGPLVESGIDISIITPLDETFATPYIPPAPEATTEIIISESLPISLDETFIPPPITPEILTNSIALDPSAVSINTNPLSSYSTTSSQNTPNEITISDPALVSANTPPVSPDIPPASSDIMPVSPVETTPTTFSPLSDAFIKSVPTNEPISANDSLPASTPFVIHQEKSIARATKEPQDKEELLRPLFYSKEAERQEPPSFANLEFKPPENSDFINPQSD